MKNSVSVVIAHHNGRGCVEKALQSIYSQTIEVHEVIVVDDGSSKDQFENLEKLSKQYGFLLFSQTNSGQSAARNLGVGKASGSLICILDQDDEFLEAHIEDLLQGWEADPRLAFVFGDAWRQSAQGEVYMRSVLREDLNIELAGVFDLARRDMVITPGMTMFSKSHFLSVGGYDESLRGYEDDDLLFRLLVAGFKGKRIDKSVLIWTLNESSTSFSISKQISRDLYFRKLNKFFSQSIFSEMGLSPFRDIFMERFYKNMLNDVFRWVSVGGDEFKTVRANLEYFCDEALVSQGLPGRQRRSVRFTRFALRSLPPRYLKTFFDFAMNLKGLLKL